MTLDGLFFKVMFFIPTSHGLPVCEKVNEFEYESKCG